MLAKFGPPIPIFGHKQARTRCYGILLKDLDLYLQQLDYTNTYDVICLERSASRVEFNKHDLIFFQNLFNLL